MVQDRHTHRRRIAVIGSGVSGLTAAHILRERAEVTLLEADDRLGGHAHTHRLTGEDGGELSVDSGFIVHNRRTYPHLVRLFDELGVETRPAEMSLSVSCDGCGLEYAGSRGARALLPTGSRAGAAHLRMLVEIPRFHRAARALLAAPDHGPGPTLGEFAADGSLSRHTVAHFLVPLVSAVWSCPPGTALDYPARYLFAFLANHGMLGVWGSPRWRTVAGGSRSYVERIAKNLDVVRTGAPVRSLERRPGGVRLRAGGDVLEFDAAVVAVHADRALSLLERPTPDERAVLGAFRYSRNRTLLHTDTSVLPRDPVVRASWNHRLPSCDPDAGAVRVSYDMNRLQHLPGRRRHLVTLNDDGRVDPRLVLAEMDYEHPVYTPAALAAQHRLPDLNDGTVAFAGAHHGWGFHEDGCASGVRAAESLGVTW
ncbi:NAD(P)/FAD-dependent oxidoreductase [Nocardiopsis changdeensis]|uniref:FAD-dependent oxidoreductase n=1 Tax=Nocardiopsis changdeensis TaxID=2831969 RepID=A0ABX8BIF6_9ACTN|nr:MULTISPECIES: FAD-dependent oxidoreductase [Nocardiopsis]QUX21119.1 FAD-dependent oxidoreductase [Nocardiopsis changdeensis]QYX37048.1 FAD-dependent oxidoreductase [Nocardiopsis sp. MT53]